MSYLRPLIGLMPKLTPTIPVQVQVCPAPLTNLAVAVCPGLKQVTSANADEAARRQERRLRRNMLMKKYKVEVGLKFLKFAQIERSETQMRCLDCRLDLRKMIIRKIKNSLYEISPSLCRRKIDEP